MLRCCHMRAGLLVIVEALSEHSLKIESTGLYELDMDNLLVYQA